MRTVLHNSVRNPIDLDADQGDREESSAIEALSRKDFLLAVVIFIVIFLPSLIPISIIDFTRHTEADRTLIAIEMLKSKNFVVPHLLGDTYLTKPPLYYTLVAGLIWLFDSSAEWVARLLSLFSGSFLVALMYIFLRGAGWRRSMALVCTTMLGCTGFLIALSVTAEIDMTYSMLSAAAFFVGYHALIGPKTFRNLVFTYALLAVSTLTKGPPSFIFWLCGAPIFSLWLYKKGLVLTNKQSLIQHVLGHIIGLVIFSSIIGVWVLLILNQVGSDEAGYRFYQELLSRFSGGESQHGSQRPFFFYIEMLFITTLPWSILLVGFIPGVRRQSVREISWRRSANDYLDIVLREKLTGIYALCIIIPAVVVLSFSVGKAARYLMPVYPLVMIVYTIGALSLCQSAYRGWLVIILRLISIVGILACMIAPFILAGTVPTVNMIFSLTAMSVSFAYLLLKTADIYNSNWSKVVIAIVIVTSVIRVVHGAVYGPYRNIQYPYRALALDFNQAIPPRKPVYIMEMLERWICYYMIQDGRTVYRLTPNNAKNLETSSVGDQRTYLLLNGDEENWRLAQLRIVDPTLAVIKSSKIRNKQFLLIEFDSAKATQLKPQKLFPTTISTPY